MLIQMCIIWSINLGLIPYKETTTTTPYYMIHHNFHNIPLSFSLELYVAPLHLHLNHNNWIINNIFFWWQWQYGIWRLPKEESYRKALMPKESLEGLSPWAMNGEKVWSRIYLILNFHYSHHHLWCCLVSCKCVLSLSSYLVVFYFVVFLLLHCNSSRVISMRWWWLVVVYL